MSFVCSDAQHLNTLPLNLFGGSTDSARRSWNTTAGIPAASLAMLSALCENQVMTRELDPKLSMLPEPQQRLWLELDTVPPEFVMYGGTALALRLGHRVSVDFDFFAFSDIDSDRLLDSVPFLKGAKVIQKTPNTLTILVNRDGAVQLSFFGVPRLGFIEEPLKVRGRMLRVASLPDLAGTKAGVVQKRAEAKDYIDLDALIQSGLIDLPTALSAARTIYGATFEPEQSLKALCYFGDGNLDTVPAATQRRLAEAVRTVDLEQLPTLRPVRPRLDAETQR